MWDLIKTLFQSEESLSESEKEIQQWAQAVKDNNWLKLHSMARAQQLEPHVFFDKVAEGYCYVYAAKVEPVRIDAWTAFRTTLENIHSPLLSEAIEIRAKGGKS